ncbi:MAG: hypothetical protein M3Y87_00110 [Myxococcota bacterium]|nr:hypothetical protein [Myxococcota bacterium]
MFAPLLVLIFGVATVAIARRTLAPSQDSDRFVLLLLLGFALRIVAHGVVRNVGLFSGGGASQGDGAAYEQATWVVVRLWEYQGFSLFSAEEIGVTAASNALLAVHVYAAIAFLSGGEVTAVGCAAFNAFLAALTCLQLFRLGTTIKGTNYDSRVVALAMYFSPAFVLYTSDMFKDGISAFLVVSAVLIAFRLSERFNPIDAVLGVLCLGLIWYVRFYLVFLVSAPLVMSLIGVRSGSPSRLVIASAFMFAAGLALIGTQSAETALEFGTYTFDHATAENVLASNASGGSGVEFSGGPWASFPLKLVYTLLSPFPWDFRSTSIGFQIGKIDALIWAFFLLRAFRGMKRMWKDDRGTLLMFLVVLVPLTIAYATTMANIGLILRQRIPIVLLGAVLAVRGVPLRRSEEASAPATPQPRVSTRPALR